MTLYELAERAAEHGPGTTQYQDFLTTVKPADILALADAARTYAAFRQMPGHDVEALATVLLEVVKFNTEALKHANREVK